MATQLTRADLMAHIRPQIIDATKHFATEVSLPDHTVLSGKVFFLTFIGFIDKNDYVETIRHKTGCKEAKVYVAHETLEYGLPGLPLSHCLLKAKTKPGFNGRYPSFFKYHDLNGEILTPYVASISGRDMLK